MFNKWTKLKGRQFLNQAETSKLHGAQLQYLTNYCTNFQKNRSKSVEVGNTKLLE